ncbi:hypothetical protein C8R45DRAFT_1101391 [Mycena sanguinolenta]|nr:hypothetical protein C8R45DRAFT_1101391 [Mycena sanguinolenta]
MTDSSALFPFAAIQTSLNDLKDSTGVFPPLKFAVGAVLEVWDLALEDRTSTCDDHAEGLAWRTVCILDAIYNASSREVGPVSVAMLDAIRTFVGLLREISAAMQEELELRHVPRLQKRESRPARFVTRLAVISEASKVRLHRYQTSSCVSEYAVLRPTLHPASDLQTIQTAGQLVVAEQVAEMVALVPGYGPSFHAEKIMVQHCLLEHEGLVQSNIRLHTKYLVGTSADVWVH